MPTVNMLTIFSINLLLKLLMPLLVLKGFHHQDLSTESNSHIFKLMDFSIEMVLKDIHNLLIKIKKLPFKNKKNRNKMIDL